MHSDSMWDIIQEIRKTKGTNNRMIVLSTIDDKQLDLLEAAYNPYLQYYLKPSKTWQTSIGDREMAEQDMRVLCAMANRTLSGAKAKQEVKRILGELTYKSGQVFLGILDKSFDIGLAAISINKVFPGRIPTHDVQLAQPFREDKVKFPCYVSTKIDGLRALYKNRNLYSRKGHIFEGLEVLEERLAILSKTLDIPSFDGELTVEGECFNELSGSLRSFKKTDNAVYHIFDIPTPNITFSIRQAALENLRRELMHLAWSNIKVLPHFKVFTMDEVNSHYHMAIGDGHEGLILRSRDGLYEGKRTYDWIKMKQENSADCKVVALFTGQGKYEGLVGGLVVDFEGKEVKVGSGLTDSQRAYWTEEPEDIIGKIVEVSYHEVTEYGSLRHPRLKRVRGDK